MKKRLFVLLLIAFSFAQPNNLSAQTNLLLNGGFEDVNTCTEYNSECGVEGWFYLRDVKAQMISNEPTEKLLGTNSFGIFYNWIGYTDFNPIIGAILPCGLQKGSSYTFKGMIYAKINPKLNLRPGICLGERFFVPKRPFSKTMKPDSIIRLQKIARSNFYEFEYSFIADGNEKYLTFGTYVEEDTVAGRRALVGTQTVSLVLDNFQLIPANEKETICPAYLANKQTVYNYNFRHKEMDYSLFGKGELKIKFTEVDSNFITQIKEPPPPVVVLKPDTLKLGDVFFDFNKANLKPEALTMLRSFFLTSNTSSAIDSIYIEGHTDSIGSDTRNLELSRQRCESIRKWFLENNVVADASIQIHPFGRSKPVATNSTAKGRAMNRRVEMIVFRKPEK